MCCCFFCYICLKKKDRQRCTMNLGICWAIRWILQNGEGVYLPHLKEMTKWNSRHHAAVRHSVYKYSL